MARSIDATALTLGVGALVTTAGGIWKSSRLRSDLIAEFQGRMALAQAALDERAATELRSLSDRVGTLLGDLEKFDPGKALADPGDLRGHVDAVSKVLVARQRLPNQFRRMLAVGPILTVAGSVLIVSIGVALAYFSGWSRNRGVGYAGLWASAAVVVLVAATTAFYFVQLHLFSRAEVLALPTSQP